MGNYFILKDKNPTEVDNAIEWAEWFEKADRSVDRTILDEGLESEITVSTVFLGMDHNFNVFSGGDDKPLIFETMIFGGEHDQYQDRCSTYEEAETMHEKALNLIKGENNDDDQS